MGDGGYVASSPSGPIAASSGGGGNNTGLAERQSKGNKTPSQKSASQPKRKKRKHN